MPLLPPTLIGKLLELDQPPPADGVETARRWADAYITYASQSVFLLPEAPMLKPAEAAFLAALTPATTLPSPVPLTFFVALEGAMRAFWATIGLPDSLVPPNLSVTPAPAPFAPLAVAIAPVGLAAPSKEPPLVMLAGIIDAWTRTHIVQGPVGPVGPLS